MRRKRSNQKEESSSTEGSCDSAIFLWLFTNVVRISGILGVSRALGDYRADRYVNR
jgi:hypothetical protein